MSRTPPARASSRWLAPALLLFGCACCVAAWVLLAMSTQRQCGWMALLAGIDAALMLRLGGMRAGLPRTVAAVLATCAVIVAANWGIAAAQLGAAMGLLPWQSALRLGADHVWTLSTLANTDADLAWMALAPAAAALASR